MSISSRSTGPGWRRRRASPAGCRPSTFSAGSRWRLRSGPGTRGTAGSRRPAGPSRRPLRRRERPEVGAKPAWQELVLTIPAGQSATPLSSVWFGEVVRIMAPAGIQGTGLGVLLARADETGLCPLIGVNGAVNVYPLGAAATAGG